MSSNVIVLLAAASAAACGAPPGGGDLADAAAADGAAIADAAGPDAVWPDAAPPDAEPLVYDCANLPTGPFELVDVGGEVTASEDLAFDREGNLVGADDTTIFKSTYAGTRTFFASLSFRAGMRYTPDGDLMVNDDNRGELVRIDSEGTKHPVLSGLSYPNGMTIGLDGYVYVTEQNARRVRRIHPITGEYTVLTSGVIRDPNGITFNEDYTALYIGAFSGVGTIYRLPIDADGNPGDLEAWATNVGTGYLDGMGVDACGNVYVCDYGASIIYRISPDGMTKTPIIDESIDFTYMPNIQWGSGIGGWKRDRLYIPEGWSHGVFEVDLGVPAKPRAYP